MKKNELIEKAKASGLVLDEEVAEKIIRDNKLDEVVGGLYVGGDKYTVAEYNKAGVTWVHNFWSYDEYYIEGVKITQQQAEKIVDKVLELGRKLSQAELLVLDIKI